MNRSVYILHQSLAEQYGILVVVTFPGHETDKRVLSECQLSALCGRSVRNYFALFYMIALKYDRTLIVAVGLVASHKFGQRIYCCCSIIILYCNFIGNRFLYGSGFLCNYAHAGVNRCFGFHTGSDNRSFSRKKRHCLTLHVGSHQGTVRVIVL